MHYVLAIHGGAGTVRPGDAREPLYHEGLREALAAGERVLAGGGHALDAVVAATMSLEDCPLFNAGRGAVFTADGTHELDAGLMEGSTLKAGAVAGVRTIRNPVQAALRLLTDGRCVLMCAEGAERFAREQGLPMVPNDYFSTAHRLAQLHSVRARSGDAMGSMALDHSAPPEQGAEPAASARFGTIGAVALDREGHLAAATSTGGMTNKPPGRIGDTPLLGGGFYANDATCAVSATGTGEHFMRACVGHDVHARMHYGGATLSEAADATMMGAVAGLGGTGGLIAIGRNGEFVAPFNSVGMYHACVRSGEAPKTSVFTPLGR